MPNARTPGARTPGVAKQHTTATRMPRTRATIDSAAPKRRKAAPVLVATEHQEQSLLFQWAEAARGRYPELRWLAAVPNGGHRAISVAKRLKAEGVKPGYPDVLLDVARGSWHGLRIELKRTKGGAVSAEQREWHYWLWAQGYCVEVCKGWEEARDVIVRYLTWVKK